MNPGRSSRAARIIRGLMLSCMLACSAPLLAQAPPPAPGTTNLDTNGDGTQDVAIRRLDTDGNAATTERVHIDANRNGVIDPGERVFDGVVGYMIINGVITIVEDTGTERVRTTLTLFDRDGDGYCDDPGEIVQSNSMPDSQASMQIRLFSSAELLNAQLAGAARFDADLNAIAAPTGFDEIPIEIVALSLTGGPQPITVTLRQLPPSNGSVVESINVVPGSMDGKRFAPAGTLESFFDVFVEVDLPGLHLIHQGPLRMTSLAGVYPPAPGQTFSLANPGVPLVDAMTGQPVGMLERFDWTPHVAPRLDCDCEKLGIMPIIVTHKDKGREVVDSPAPSGAVHGAGDDDAKIYDVEIEVEWAVTIKCRGPGPKCEGKFAPTATSEGWMIDGKKSAPVGLDSHEAVGGLSDVVCTGNCDNQEISVHPPPKTLYKVSVKKGAGGIITHKVSGVITLAMNPIDCVGDPWKMVLVYEADIKKGDVRIDPLLSNWDGDKKINAADKNPLDPKKQ